MGFFSFSSAALLFLFFFFSSSLANHLDSPSLANHHDSPSLANHHDSPQLKGIDIERPVSDMDISYLITIYGSGLGARSFLLDHFSVFINSILQSFGMSEEMYNPVGFFVLLGIIDALGYWIVRRFFISKNKSCGTQIKGDYYSTFHKIRNRKKFTKKEWDEFTNKSTNQALAEMTASPEFADWIMQKAYRIKLLPRESSDETWEVDSKAFRIKLPPSECLSECSEESWEEDRIT